MDIRPDLERGRAFLARNPVPGRLLVCGVTGSHFYGFPAPDSDLDLKGIHVCPTTDVLGLFPPAPAFDTTGDERGLSCDFTSNEVGQALGLLLKGNGNMLERVFSPFQVFETPEREDLRAMAPAWLSRRFHAHYKGFFHQVCQQHVKDADGRIKSHLYAYRVALTGVHLLQTGEVVGDLNRLGPEYGFGEVAELIARYRRSSERDCLSPADDARFRERWPALFAALEAAWIHSSLPEEPRDPHRCSDWLVALRRRMANWSD